MVPGGIYLCNCEQQISSHMLSWSKSVISDTNIRLTALHLFASILTKSIDGEKDSFFRCDTGRSVLHFSDLFLAITLIDFMYSVSSYVYVCKSVNLWLHL